MSELKNFKDFITEGAGSIKITKAHKAVIKRMLSSKYAYEPNLSQNEKFASYNLGLVVDDTLGVFGSVDTEESKDAIRNLKTLVNKKSTPEELLPNNVHITNRLATDGYHDVIAVIKQKTAKNDQLVFAASAFDIGEFGKGMNEDEVLVRLSSPLSKKTDNFNRTIARVSAKKGKLRWIDNEAYENGKIVWERALKVQYFTIDEDSLDYFKVW